MMVPIIYDKPGGPCAQDRYPFFCNTQREGETQIPSWKEIQCGRKKSTPHVYVQPLEVKRHHPETLSSKPISVQHLESLYSRKKNMWSKNYLMRVTVHWELMENCINNGNFAKNTSASAYDTLNEMQVKTM